MSEVKNKEEKFKAFKKALKKVFSDYNASIYESENYDGEESYSGSDFHIEIDGEVFWDKTINEILNEL